MRTIDKEIHVFFPWKCNRRYKSGFAVTKLYDHYDTYESVLKIHVENIRNILYLDLTFLFLNIKQSPTWTSGKWTQ